MIPTSGSKVRSITFRLASLPQEEAINIAWQARLAGGWIARVAIHQKLTVYNLGMHKSSRMTGFERRAAVRWIGGKLECTEIDISRLRLRSEFEHSRGVPIIRFQLRQHPVRVESAMSETSKVWNGELVRGWLESRLQAARLDQAAADKRGYEARDDYDKAAAEEWVCRTLKNAGRTECLIRN